MKIVKYLEFLIKLYYSIDGSVVQLFRLRQNCVIIMFTMCCINK